MAKDCIEKGGDNINSYNFKQASRLAVFFALLFVVCVAWFYAKGSQPLHQELLALTFFGWSGMNAVSIISGLAQSVVAGYIAYGLWLLTKPVTH